MPNLDDFQAAGWDPQGRQKAIRGLGYSGAFGNGAADAWLKGKYGTAKLADIANRPSADAGGIMPLNKASMNTYQKDSLYGMGKLDTNVDPNVAKNYGKVGTAIDAARTPYDPNSYKQFMNPYIDEVVNRNASTIGRTYGAKRNDINQQFAEAGGYGSTAQGVERSLNSEAEARQIGDMDAQLRAAGFDSATNNATNMYNNDRNANFNAATAYSGLAGNQMGADQYTKSLISNALASKLTAGERIQQDQQGQLDAYYGEKTRESQYTPQQIAFLQQVLGAYPTGQTSTTSQPGVGTLQGALGGGLLGSQMFGAFGGGANTQDTAARRAQTGNSGFIGPLR